MAGTRPPSGPTGFSRRERQIMDVIYRLGEAAVGTVLQERPDAPSYSAVRALMNVLVDKGHLERRRRGRKFLYRPTVAPAKARRSALTGLVDTFFAGSVDSAVAALLDLRARNLDDDELNRIARKIEDARRERKKP